MHQRSSSRLRDSRATRGLSRHRVAIPRPLCRPEIRQDFRWRSLIATMIAVNRGSYRVSDIFIEPRYFTACTGMLVAIATDRLTKRETRRRGKVKRNKQKCDAKRMKEARDLSGRDTHLPVLLFNVELCYIIRENGSRVLRKKITRESSGLCVI